MKHCRSVTPYVPTRSNESTPNPKPEACAPVSCPPNGRKHPFPSFPGRTNATYPSKRSKRFHRSRAVRRNEISPFHSSLANFFHRKIGYFVKSKIKWMEFSRCEITKRRGREISVAICGQPFPPTPARDGIPNPAGSPDTSLACALSHSSDSAILGRSIFRTTFSVL